MNVRKMKDEELKAVIENGITAPPDSPERLAMYAASEEQERRYLREYRLMLVVQFFGEQD